MKRLPRTLAHLALAGLLVIPGLAQTTAPSAPAPAADPKVVELSPFTVSAEDEAGYRAKHTLSGSRMRLNLDDVSIPMDIITPELMEDFNINQQEDLFNIVSNMESRQDNFLSGVYESGASYSIRGFVGVKSLRNFVASGMPFDRYNSSSFVASKGPNAILYGSGPGGGSISYFTKRYLLGGKDRTDLRTSVDSEGSARGEISLNKVLIPDKLGLNVSAFRDYKQFYIKPAYEARSGYYLNVAFKPLKNTLINASYEKRKDDIFRPASDYTTLIDYNTAWTGFGQPAVTTANLTNNTAALRYPDGRTVTGANVTQFGMARQSARALTLIDGKIVDTFNTAVTDTPSTANSPQGQRSIPQAIKDYWPTNVGPTGLNGGAEARSEAFDITLEQKVTDQFYLTAAYGKTITPRIQYQHRIRELRRDPNYYAPGGNGALNPHFGEYYLELGNVNYFDRNNETETTSVMATYELNLERHQRFLGKHNFAVMYQKSAELNTNVRQSMRLTQSPDPTYRLTDVNNAATALSIRQYITIGGHMDDYRYIRTKGFENGGYKWEIQDGVGGTGWNNTETFSKMFVMQSSFLKNRLITNVGYRQEDVDQFIVNFANNPAMANRQTAYEHFTKAQSQDPTYVRVLTNNVRPTSLPSVPWESVSGLSKNVGVIFKVTPNIALIANQAQNISGAAGRIGVFGLPLPFAQGKSEDYGLRFNLFNSRMRLEYNRYETAVTNQAVQGSGGSIRVPYNNALNLWQMMIQAGSGKQDVFLNSEDWDTRDFVSKGDEITVTGDPVRGLSMRVAVSRNVQSANNLGGTFMPWWNANKADIEKFVAANPNAINRVDTATTPQTAATHWTNALNLLRLRDDLEGQAVINVPIWTAKMVAKYRFQGEILRGHETGANVAWRGKQKSNYFRRADGTSDLNDPFYTDSTTVVNLFWNYSRRLNFLNKPITWRVQLNVNNAFNNDVTLRTNFFNTVNGDKNSPVINTGLRRSDPRLFSLTNSFSF
ncbi:MAG: hypothetical protein JNK23_20290 [Opitutaceae bacterium]|nr:hypothetical protein [Opitutaceae bacterium]